MKISCWYKNGSLDCFRQFCIQNQDKPISVKLTNRSKPIIGYLYKYCLDYSESSHLFLLLTKKVTHPAYFGLDGIESLHVGFNDSLSTLIDGAHIKDISPSEIIDSMNMSLLSEEWN